MLTAIVLRDFDLFVATQQWLFQYVQPIPLLFVVLILNALRR